MIQHIIAEQTFDRVIDKVLLLDQQVLEIGQGISFVLDVEFPHFAGKFEFNHFFLAAECLQMVFVDGSLGGGSLITAELLLLDDKLLSLSVFVLQIFG